MLQPLPLDDAHGANRVQHTFEDLAIERGTEERLSSTVNEVGHDAAERPHVDPPVGVLGA